MSWQTALAADVVARADADDRIPHVELVGSATSPGLLDRWSDVDVHLELTSDVALHDLAPGLDVWAVERRPAPGSAEAVRVVGRGGERLDLLSSGAGGVIVPPPADAAALDARFLAMLATARLGRGDRLIGVHLAFRLAERCLEQGMALRDRDEGTTRHRGGTGRDILAGVVTADLGDPVDAAGVLRLLRRFDALHAELDPAYRSDAEPLARVGTP